MSDILEELLTTGAVPNEKLLEELRRKHDYGLAGAFSGSERIAEPAGSVYTGALQQAKGIGDTRNELSQAAAEQELEAWKAEMASLDKEEQRKALYAIARMNNEGRLEAARIRAGASKKGAQFGPGGLGGTLKNQLDDATHFAEIAEETGKRVGMLSSGFVGGSTQWIPGSPSHNLQKEIEPLVSQEAFSKLQEMRMVAAELGQKGSGLGAVTEREISLLQSHYTNLDVSQSPPQLRKHLKLIANQWRKVEAALAADLAAAQAQGLLNEGSGGALGGRGGVDLSFLSDEDQAAFAEAFADDNFDDEE